jgi:hypothetical protein
MYSFGQTLVWPELTSSSIAKGDVLPALSFSLLFRFQGAVAHATLTLAGVGVALGGISAFRSGSKHYPQAAITATSSSRNFNEMVIRLAFAEQEEASM